MRTRIPTALPRAPMEMVSWTPTVILRVAIAAICWLAASGCHDDRTDDAISARLARRAAEAAEPSRPADGEGIRDGRLRAYFLDVGQGDATLLAGPDFTILVDAGRHTGNEVVPLLLAAGVKKIDLLIGTHPHADHIGQFPDVLRAFPVTEVWMSGDEHTSRTFERALDAVLASGAGYHEPRTGEALRLGSARVEVLNPSEVDGDLHNGCVAVRVAYGEVAILLTGDAEIPAERRMIASGFPLRAQVLQLGHHGSSTSNGEEFLREVRPEVAIYSAGEGNSYGHPHAEVIERFRRHRVPVYGTDRDGTIMVVSDGRRFEVRPGIEIRTTGGPVGGAEIAINTAPKESLVRIAHISPERADELIRIRPLRSIDELTEINGIGPARLRDIKRQGLIRLE